MENSLTTRDAVVLIARMLHSWGLSPSDFAFVDAVGLSILGYDIPSPELWRQHVNVYVDETQLPWKTSEKEETVPPIGSGQLEAIIKLGRQGVSIHLVPAHRYFLRGFEVKSCLIDDDLTVTASTLRGCLTVWLMRAIEFLDQRAEYTEAEFHEIAGLRVERLRGLKGLTTERTLGEEIERLIQGYSLAEKGDGSGARKLFGQEERA